jgi:hypothetical protein
MRLVPSRTPERGMRAPRLFTPAGHSHDAPRAQRGAHVARRWSVAYGDRDRGGVVVAVARGRSCGGDSTPSPVHTSERAVTQEFRCRGVGGADSEQLSLGSGLLRLGALASCPQKAHLISSCARRWKRAGWEAGIPDEHRAEANEFEFAAGNSRSPPARTDPVGASDTRGGGSRTTVAVAVEAGEAPRSLRGFPQSLRRLQSLRREAGHGVMTDFPEPRPVPVQGRMNSRQQPHEVRLRGLSGTGECHAAGWGYRW